MRDKRVSKPRKSKRVSKPKPEVSRPKSKKWRNVISVSVSPHPMKGGTRVKSKRKTLKRT